MSAAMSLALLFPGQGSQHVGMGRELARSYPVAASTFEEADDVLGFPLSRVAWEGPGEELTETRNAQPAILTHSVAVLRVLAERLPAPSMAAGHSLGEFTAHVAAGTLGFADALQAVRLRGELMFRAGVERPGRMAAVLGLDDEAVEAACREASSAGGVCVPANFNSPGQVVVSGDEEGVERGMEAARRAGARRVVELNVSGAFHSPLMEPAETGLRTELDAADLSDPRYPVYSNVTAGPIRTADEARELLVRQLTSPVRWSEAVRRMVEDGAQRFAELGPGNVLCGLGRRNARGVGCASLGEPSDLASLDEILERGEERG